MALLPGISLLLGLTDLLSLNVGLQIPGLEFGPRIQDARIEDYPYQVSLRVKDEHRCGGSIISENKILTAAHCVFNIPIRQLSVRVGSSVHFEGEPVTVSAVEIHPTYNRRNLDCDVAFVTLGIYLKFGPLVKPIELAERLPPDGTLAVVTGWGVLNNDVTPNYLNVITVRLINQNSCRAWYPYEVLTKRMVCASHEEFPREPCRGDSGGPLVDISTGKQVGVVSWGAGCLRTDVPTVYASVPESIHSREVKLKVKVRLN